MDENRIEGGLRDAAGRVQDSVGGLMGDSKTQADGKMRQAAGQAQQAYGQAADSVRDTAEQVSEMVRGQPLTALLVAAGIGYVIGMLRR